MGGIWNGSKHGGESRVGCEGSVGRHATGCSQANPPYMASWDQQHMHQLDLFQLSAKFGVICNKQWVCHQFHPIASHSTCSLIKFCDLSDSKNLTRSIVL